MRGPLAQLAEHLPFKQGVAGSSPARLTFFLEETVRGQAGPARDAKSSWDNQELSTGPPAQERETGFEPATYGLEGRCATIALLPHTRAHYILTCPQGQISRAHIYLVPDLTFPATSLDLYQTFFP